MAKRDFLYDTAEAPKESAAQFLSALKMAGKNACSEVERCEVCLNPCSAKAAEPLPSVVKMDEDVHEVLIAFDKALGAVTEKRGGSMGNSTVMSAGAKLVGILAGISLDGLDPIEQLAVKLQAAAAIAQLEMSVKVLAKQAIDGLPLIVAMAKVLDKEIRKSSGPIAEELEAYKKRKSEKQA
jgi:hypothetical protein